MKTLMTIENCWGITHHDVQIAPPIPGLVYQYGVLGVPANFVFTDIFEFYGIPIPEPYQFGSLLPVALPLEPYRKPPNRETDVRFNEGYD